MEVVIVVLLTLSPILTSVLDGFDTPGYNEVNDSEGEANAGCDVCRQSKTESFCDKRAVSWRNDLTKAEERVEDSC